MTELGIIGDANPIVVDKAGTAARLGSNIRLQWWVGAEDRWHFVPDEAAVRQALALDGSAVETRLRVPGGDVVQRCVVVPTNGASAAVIEIENETPVPVALALVVSGFDGSVEVQNDTVLVDGTPLLRAGRSVARALVAANLEAAMQATQDGAAQPPAETTWPKTGRVVVVIVPLPHTTKYSFSFSGQRTEALAAPQDLPPLDAVARGWESHVGAGMRLLVADDRVMQVAKACQRHLLAGSVLEPGSRYWASDTSSSAPAIAAVALDAWAHRIEGRELLLAASGLDDLAVHATRPVEAAGALLWAWAERLERQSEPELETALAPWVEEVAITLLRRPGWFARRRGQTSDDAWRALGLACAGSLLTRQGNQTLGSDIVDALPALLEEVDPAAGALPFALGGARLGLTDVSVFSELTAMLGLPLEASWSAVLAKASPTGAFHNEQRSQHPSLSALFLLALRRAVVHEPAGCGGVIDLMADPDTGWLGAPIEVQNAPVTGGTAGFGVRWHGERPALLWDVVTTNHTVALAASGLDGSWSGEGAKGESLLGVTPGLVQGPATPKPQPTKPRAPSSEPDAEPDSFG